MAAFIPVTQFAPLGLTFTTTGATELTDAAVNILIPGADEEAADVQIGGGTFNANVWTTDKQSMWHGPERTNIVEAVYDAIGLAAALGWFKGVEALRAVAAFQVARYPQYAGHFDTYEEVRISRNFETKLGLAFAEDDVAIAPPCDDPDAVDCRTVWSFRNALDTSVWSEVVLPLSLDA